MIKYLLLSLLSGLSLRAQQFDAVDFLKQQQESLNLAPLYRERKARALKVQLEALDEQILAACSEAVRAALVQQKTQLIQNDGLVEAGRYRNGAQSIKSERVALEIINQRENSERLAKSHVDGSKAAAGETARVWSEALLSKKTAGLIALTALGIAAAWQGTKLAVSLLDHLIRIPELAQETSIKTWSQTLYGGPSIEKIELSDVILEPQLAGRMQQLTQMITNTALHNHFFRHFLFYGPPGTGKTMLAKAIAHNAGLKYIYFSASKLEIFSTEEGLKKITQLFQYAQNSDHKLMIIMDEADALFAKRDDGAQSLSQKSLIYLENILTYMGTENPNFMVIAISNRPAVFDDAALSRFGEQIKIGAPGLEERKLIVRRYLQKYLVDKPQADTRNLLLRTFNPAPKPEPLSLAPDITNSVLDDIAQKLVNFVGRDISDLMRLVQGMAYASDNHVTKNMLYEATDQKIGQKKLQEKHFVD